MPPAVSLDENVVTEYNDFELRKNNIEHFIYKITGTSTSPKIVIAKTSTDTNYEDFLLEFEKDECSYAIIRVGHSENVLGGRICFIHWAPHAAKIRQKLLYATSESTLLHAIGGVQIRVQANEIDDISALKVHKQIVLT